LAVRGVSVDMVEHVLAALAGLRIDNCEIWVDRAEMPGCDGSSQAYVEALLGARIVRQDAPRRQLVVSHPVEVGDATSWIRAEPDFGQLTVEYLLDYPQHPAIGRQYFCTPINPRSFVEQLAPSRTFVLESEAQWFREQGFGRRTRYQDLPGSPTNAYGTRPWTSLGTWPWPPSTSSDESSRAEADTT
jgi:UDP-3-O-acyl-N-acetylglucosamine deacetylase